MYRIASMPHIYLYIVYSFFFIQLLYYNYKDYSLMEAATMLTVVKIGDKLREMRTRRLLTQVQLAEKSGVNQVTIARIERNQVDPRFSTIRKLAKALDVDPIKLIGD
jgi:DNA-binding XRE family transcriptional regulator